MTQCRVLGLVGTEITIKNNSGETTTVATDKVASPYRRASDIVQGIGENLKSIAGRDVLLTAYSVDQRAMTDSVTKEKADRTIVLLQVAVNIDNPDEITTFHAWSESLAEKLGELTPETLPVIINFDRVQTRAGFDVWSFS